jgi:hypothetical protein
MENNEEQLFQDISNSNGENFVRHDSELFQRFDSDIQRGVETSLRGEPQIIDDLGLFKKDSLVLISETQNEISEVRNIS